MKNNADVLINGKIYTVCGKESEDYFQQVASYIDRKIEECEKIKNYRYQDAQTRNILLALNIADDMFKAQEKIDALTKEAEDSENKLYTIKHDLIGLQMKYEEMQRALKKAEEKIDALSLEKTKLEGKLEEKKKNREDV